MVLEIGSTALAIIIQFRPQNIGKWPLLYWAVAIVIRIDLIFSSLRSAFLFLHKKPLCNQFSKLDTLFLAANCLYYCGSSEKQPLLTFFVFTESDFLLNKVLWGKIKNLRNRTVLVLVFCPN